MVSKLHGIMSSHSTLGGDTPPFAGDINTDCQHLNIGVDIIQLYHACV